MPIESVLSANHKESLEIQDFIFHVIGDTELEPELLDRVILDVAQEEFFKKRILEACEGTQFLMQQRDTDFYLNCASIIDHPDENFVSASKRLATSFHNMHRGNTKPGIFIVSRITVIESNNPISLISILKVDYEEVYQQVAPEEDTELHIALFRSVQKAISGNKDAVQKWAIIDISETFAWDVLAKDRGKSKVDQDTDKAISRYFKQYLGATVRENDSVWTRRSITAVNGWAQSYEDLPDNEERSNYKARAINYLSAVDTFNGRDFVDFVVKDEQSPERKERAKNALYEHLAEKGIAGQEFSPKRDSIPANVNRTKVKTVEGAILEWSGEMELAGITRNQVNGMTEFIVSSSSYVEE